MKLKPMIRRNEIHRRTPGWRLVEIAFLSVVFAWSLATASHASPSADIVDGLWIVAAQQIDGDATDLDDAGDVACSGQAHCSGHAVMPAASIARPRSAPRWVRRAFVMLRSMSVVPIDHPPNLAPPA